MTVIAPYQPQVTSGGDGFRQLLRAEWTKFRTVRGWIITLLVTVLVMVGFGLLSAAGTSSSCAQRPRGPGPAAERRGAAYPASRWGRAASP